MITIERSPYRDFCKKWFTARCIPYTNVNSKCSEAQSNESLCAAIQSQFCYLCCNDFLIFCYINDAVPINEETRARSKRLTPILTGNEKKTVWVYHTHLLEQKDLTKAICLNVIAVFEKYINLHIIHVFLHIRACFVKLHCHVHGHSFMQ